MESNGGDEGRPEVDREVYARYREYMEQKFEESPKLAEYKAKFQARKDAKLAREAAARKEVSEEHQPSSSVPLEHDAAAGANPLQAWNPRKHPMNKNYAQELPTDPKLSVPHQPKVPRHTNDPAFNARRPPDTGLGSTKLGELKTTLSFSDKSTPRNATPSSRKSSSASETLPSRPKRPADHSIHEDARPKLPKRPRRSSSISLSEVSEQIMVRSTGINRRPPQWYKELPKPNNTRDANKSDEETMLFRIKDAIRTAKASNAQNRDVVLPTQFGKIISMVHKIIFLNVTDKLLRKTRMLDNNDGLPQLFDDEFSGGVPWPWYLRADAEELYNKWCGKVFETDLYRGLIRAMRGKGKGLSTSSDTLGKDSKHYRLVNPKQHGNGLLINGTWWPTQLAVLRDGGHGSSQGGITSDPVEGAFSVIMAGGLDPNNKPYPNIDRGDEVLYCGTDNPSTELNEPSRDTKAMILNHKNGQPVRLFRSSNLGSKFAPELGFRYDGLYSVVGFEVLDPPEEKRKRHRFRLLRCEGQDPIRSEGPEKRPTKEEIYEYEKDKKNRGR